MNNIYPSPSHYAANNRGAVKPGEYLILPEANRCPAFHSNFKNTDESVLVTKKFGANYVMSELALQEGGSTINPIKNRLEHFFYVLDGEIMIMLEDENFMLTKGGYAWLPPELPFEMKLSEPVSARLLWFRKPYQYMMNVDVPQPVFGNEKDVKAVREVDINPEKQLLPYTDQGFDMAFNLIVCQAGGYYGLVESHAWEHAMYMLEGEGILVLNNQYYHVMQDDFIHIHPYCPEWFTASGMEQKPVRFLLYWDCNRDYENYFL